MSLRSKLLGLKPAYEGFLRNFSTQHPVFIYGSLMTFYLVLTASVSPFVGGLSATTLLAISAALAGIDTATVLTYRTK